MNLPEEARKYLVPVREVIVAKLARARAGLADLQQKGHVDATAIEWQRGYVAALEEMLELDGLALRRRPRRPTVIPAEIARIDSETGPASQRDKATILDLSMGGCGLNTTAELSVGENVVLSFTLPAGGLPITVKGSVRHAERLVQQLRVGVEFKALSADTAKALQAFLAFAPS